MSDVEAGWYPDPADPQRARFWAGDRWTERTVPLAELLAATASASEHGSVVAPSEPSSEPRESAVVAQEPGHVADQNRAEAPDETAAQEPSLSEDPEPHVETTLDAVVPEGDLAAPDETLGSDGLLPAEEVPSEPVTVRAEPEPAMDSAVGEPAVEWFPHAAPSAQTSDSQDWWTVPAVPTIAIDEAAVSQSSDTVEAPTEEPVATNESAIDPDDDAGGAQTPAPPAPQNPIPAPPAGWARSAEPSPYLPDRGSGGYTNGSTNGSARLKSSVSTQTSVDGWWRPGPLESTLGSAGGAAVALGPTVSWPGARPPVANTTAGRPHDSWFMPVRDPLELPDRLWEAVRPITEPTKSNGHPNGVSAQPGSSKVVQHVVIARVDWSPDGAWFTIFGGLLIAIGTFLPWLMANVVGASFTRDAYQLGTQAKLTFDGPLCVVLGTLTVGLGIMRLVRHDLPALLRRASLVSGLIVGLVVVDRWSGAHSLVTELNNHGPVIAIVGYGYWMCAGGAVLALLGGLLAKGARDNLEVSG